MKLLFAVLPVVALAVSAADTPVVVNNTVKNAVPVLVQAPRETFTFTKEITNPGGVGQVEYTLFSVPAGKKLVIETISARSRGLGLSDLRVRYNAPLTQSFLIPLTAWPVQPTAAGEGVILSGLHNVRLYVGANQTVRLQVVGGGATNSQTFIDVAVSGHLVDEI